MAKEWYAQTMRTVHILEVSPAWTKGQGERFSARDCVEGLRTASVDFV